MQALKIRKIGNSMGIILTKQMLDKMHAKEGDDLFAVETPGGYELSPHAVDFSEQMKLVDEIMLENDEVLRALAQ